MQRKQFFCLTIGLLGITLLAGCSHQQPVNMAPPMNNSQMAPPMNNGMNNGQMAQPMNQAQQGGGVYQWQEVPQGQQVPIQRATFDQGGYQVFAQSGETIVVPFVNQNLYAMKFGRANGQSYFVNNGDAPILYLAPGGFLENAAAQNARWYPIPDNYAYSNPMYVTLAPSWNEYSSMGWYPGMNYYGGMWSYRPYGSQWMPGFYVNVGGSRYTSWGGYHSYYMSTPGYIRTTTVYNNYSTPRGSYGGFGSTRSTGGFGNTRTTNSNGGFGNTRATNSTGSFGGGRSNSSTMGGGSTNRGSFGGGNSSTMGGGSAPRSSFGNSAPSAPTGGRSTSGSFGGGNSSTSGGGGRATSGSFGGGGSSSRPSSGSFGGGRRR